jgi:hypothetical protein
MDKPLTQMPGMPTVPNTGAPDNPLKKFYRQPAIYITLPSKGHYYDKESFVPTETGEIPILPMTAKDEMTLKTPDALINGQATVDVIESCVPNIKNAWKVINHDVDALLLAIRIATYGETMNLNGTVPGTGETVEHTVNLPALLEHVGKVNITDSFSTASGFQVKVQPLNYKKLTDTQISAFEKQKQYVVMSSRTDIPEVERGKLFAENFKQLTEMNFNILQDAVTELKTPEGDVVTDKNMIIDFLNNAPKKITEEIQKGLAANRNQAALPPVKLKATEEQIKKGAPANYELPITFDSANFFV